MTPGFLAVPGGRLHVLDEGAPEDPPIVLLHAGIADLRSWDDLVPLLVRGGFRVIRYDARGYGRSETQDVEFSDRADLIAILEDRGIGQAVLVGNSRGGRIAFDTAIEYPDRVAAVVGVAAGIGGFKAALTPVEVEAFDRMEALESADVPDAAAIADIDVRLWVDGPGQPETRVPNWIRELVREMDAAGMGPDHVDGKPVALSPAAVDRLEDLHCPILAVAGDLDVSEAAAAAHHLEAAAPNARAVILPGVAHMIGMEVPDELARLIIDFVAPLPRWS